MTEGEPRIDVLSLIYLSQSPAEKDIPIFHALGSALAHRPGGSKAKQQRSKGNLTDKLTDLILAAQTATLESLPNIGELGTENSGRLSPTSAFPKYKVRVESRIRSLRNSLIAKQVKPAVLTSLDATNQAAQSPQSSGENVVESKASATQPNQQLPEPPEGSLDDNKLGTGAGFGSAEQNREVEDAARCLVRESYESQGFVVKSRESENLGYDLEAVQGQEEWHLEVKGISGSSADQFIITANEVKCAGLDPKWRAAIVVNALGESRKLVELSGMEFLQQYDLRPISYRAVKKPKAQ